MRRLLLLVAICLAATQFIRADSHDGLYDLRIRAEQGDPDAQRRLGAAYRYGLGVSRDNGEAVRWYQLAAEKDDVSARHHLVFMLVGMYRDGTGTSQDLADGLKWARLTAEQGDVWDKQEVGFMSIGMYEDGTGGPEYLVEGLKWLSLAFELADESFYEVNWCGTPYFGLYGLASESQEEAAKEHAREWMQAHGLKPSEYLGSFVHRIRQFTPTHSEQPSDLQISPAMPPPQPERGHVIQIPR